MLLCLRNSVLPLDGDLNGRGGLLAIPLRRKTSAFSAVPHNEGKFSDSNIERIHVKTN